MKIQVALDRLTEEECFEIAGETVEFIDWIEIGTGVIKEYGMSIVREMKQKYPTKTLVADMKTCDAGKHEAKQAFVAGADIITVMAFSHNNTIKETLEVGEQYNRQVMIDFLGINDRQRVREIYELGARIFCLHVGKDMQAEGILANRELLELVEGIEDITIAVAGGISEKTIGNLAGTGIDVAIVGSAITASMNPKAASRELRNLVNTTK